VEASTKQLILPPDKAIDLQLHTIYSDGTWTPEQLINYLVGEGFGLAAITDHDRMDTIASLQRLAAEKQFPLLVAVEISASWNGEPTDVLCYGFDLEKKELSGLTQDVVRRQQENTKEVYENLLGKGYVFGQQPDEFAALLATPSARQPHELVALVKRYGYGTGETSPGKIVLEAGCIFATVDIAAVVEAAHRSGGVCLIAHPGRGDGYIAYDVDLLDQLRQEVPIDGFEVYYPAHTSEQIAMYLEYAQKHNLLTSSGSDSHGPDKKPIKYAADLSRSLLERLGIQVQ
jgi:predicted metal-dependent phosphoesterase TrpH